MPAGLNVSAVGGGSCERFWAGPVVLSLYTSVTAIIVIIIIITTIIVVIIIIIVILVIVIVIIITTIIFTVGYD